MPIQNHFVDICTYARTTGTDGSGSKTRAAAVEFTGRVVHNSKRTRNALGEDVVSLIQIQTLNEVQLNDLVTLPDGSSYEPLAIKKAQALSKKFSLYEVLL